MIKLNQLHPGITTKIAELFSGHHLVDATLDSILAGQYGGNISITVDDEYDPHTIQIRQGSFILVGGDSASPTAYRLMKELPPGCFIMPAPEEWMKLAGNIHGERLRKTRRYSFSGSELDKVYLTELLKSCQELMRPEPIDHQAAQIMLGDELHHHHFANFESIEHFLDTGFGYCIGEKDRIITACTSTLVARRKVEVSITTSPGDRGNGYATLTAARFLVHCLENDWYPNWDAGNLVSVRLAKKLGYRYLGPYDVYYLI